MQTGPFSPIFRMSSVYKHIRAWMPRNSMVIMRMHKQCVPGACSPSPCLRTRVILVFTSLVPSVVQGTTKHAYSRKEVR